jgi:bisphosphoglycerate-dependent phosphoglycerate mutase
LKYDSVGPKGNYEEFKFTFTLDHQKELEEMAQKLKKVFVVLVCLKAREVCVITLEQFKKMVVSRQKAAKVKEDQYQILATARKNQKLRVYVNNPGSKGKQLGEIKVARNAFPSVLFE